MLRTIEQRFTWNQDWAKYRKTTGRQLEKWAVTSRSVNVEFACASKRKVHLIVCRFCSLPAGVLPHVCIREIVKADYFKYCMHACTLTTRTTTRSYSTSCFLCRQHVRKIVYRLYTFKVFPGRIDVNKIASGNVALCWILVVFLFVIRSNINV